MRTIALALRSQREQRCADQRGLSLISVLLVMLVMSLTVTGMVGLLLVTLKVGQAQELAMRERLALDGAIEAATNQLRYNPGAVFADPCGAMAPVQPVTQQEFLGADGQPLRVDVECSDGEADAGATGDRVQLVGTGGFQGSGDFDWRSWTSQWTAAAGAVPTLTPQPNLVHLGREPLRFNSGVTVRNGAAVLRDVATASPAVITTGEYTQSALGPFGAAGPNACGLLAGVGGVNNSGAGRISDVSGVPSCGDASALAINASPTGAFAGFATDGEFSAQQAPLDPPVNNWQCTEGSDTTPEVVNVYPGRYTQAQVNKLNQVLNPRVASPGTARTTFPVAQCYRRTFYFHPGVYYFDADYLDFNNKSAYYVMGEPLGWNPVPTQEADGVTRHGVVQTRTRPNVADRVFLNPDAPLCNPERSGVSFVLAPRTEIRHRAGRLAMCPAFDSTGRAYPAISQETSVRSGVTVTPRAGALDSRIYRSCTRPTVDTYEFVSFNGAARCAHTRAYLADVAAGGNSPLTSAAVKITGYQQGDWGQPGGDGGGPHNVIEARQTQIEVLSPTTSVVCSTGWLSGMPTGLSGSPMTASFELLSTSGVGVNAADRCATKLTSSSQLAQAVLRIRHRLIWSTTQDETTALLAANALRFAAGQPAIEFAQTFKVDDIALVLNGRAATSQPSVESPVPGTPANPAGAPTSFDPSTLANAKAPGGGGATPQMICGDVFCPVDVAAGLDPSQVFRHSLRLGQLQFEVDPQFLSNSIDPNVADLRVELGLDPSASFPDLTVDQFLDLQQAFGGIDSLLEFLGAPPATLENATRQVLQSWLDTISSRAVWSWWLRESRIRVEVATPASGTLCVVAKGPVASTQSVSIDLLDPDLRGPSCPSTVQTWSQLQGSTLSVTFESPCVRDPSSPRTRCLEWGTAKRYLQLRPPSVDSAQLVVTTDSYSGARPQSQIDIKAFTTETVGEAIENGDPDYGSSFNVRGRAWLPLHDLRIHWRGKVIANRPLFSGGLVLNGLGSRTYGTTAMTSNVCCEEQRPETRTVVFTAKIDGRPRLKVRVMFTDVKDPTAPGGAIQYEAGHKVEVLDWRVCTSGACT